MCWELVQVGRNPTSGVIAPIFFGDGVLESGGGIKLRCTLLLVHVCLDDRDVSRAAGDLIAPIPSEIPKFDQSVRGCSQPICGEPAPFTI